MSETNIPTQGRNALVAALEATYTWKTTADFERFMRFAQRYADSHELGFAGKEGDETVENQGDEFSEA